MSENQNQQITQIQTSRRAPYLEASSRNFLDLLAAQVGRAPGS